MAKTGFEKATSKMFGDFGSSVKVAQPGGGERLSREERERMRKEAEAEALEEAKAEKSAEQREIIKTLVDMNVIPQQGGEASPAEKVPEAQAPRQGRGRPAKDPDGGPYVLMNFRVTEEFRTKVKVTAAEQGRQVLDLFTEAFGLFFEKYHIR